MMQAVETRTWKLDLGATPKGSATAFKVWAPHHTALLVVVEGKGTFPLQRKEHGYFTALLEGIGEGDRYQYKLENGLLRPDPVSRSLPKGVHGVTEIVDPTFDWDDEGWRPPQLRDLIFYELHVGTFTKEGTFDSLIEKLPYLLDLGINCIELMPIGQFPGRWNWGYDGASPFAPHSGYGGHRGLKRLVNACHQAGIAVCLDVVYNHLGPEGNYLGEFAPYFSGRYHTPWGQAFNYDGPHSDAVRAFAIKNALHWISEYHIDALRLDAIHGIYDFSATSMIEELTTAAHNLNPAVSVIAESDLNDPRILRPRERGGWELDGLWNDDYHHAVHVALTGERHGYYRDFHGLPDVARALTHAFVYDGKYSPFRDKRHGAPARDLPLDAFLSFIQNHDQIGNRPFGERLSHILTPERLRLIPFFTLMTPFTPLLFMGQEYGEQNPFAYFVDFEEEKLMRAIVAGRKKEFHRDDMPFPGKEAYLASHLSWKLDAPLHSLYRSLIALRKAHPPKPSLKGSDVHVSYSTEEEWIRWEYPTQKGKTLTVICHLGETEITLPGTYPLLSIEGVSFGGDRVTLLPNSAIVL